MIRKLVIRAGEAGYKVEQEDVKRNLFIPENYFEGSLDDFWRNIQGLDAQFEEKRQQLEAEDKHFRFVAKMENGARRLMHTIRSTNWKAATTSS